MISCITLWLNTPSHDRFCLVRMSLHANLSVLSSSKTRWMMAVRITAQFPCPRHGCLQHITCLEFENMTSKFGSDFGIVEPLCNSSLHHIQYQGARLKNENLEIIPKATHIPTYRRHMDALSRPRPEKTQRSFPTIHPRPWHTKRRQFHMVSDS